MEVKMGRTIFGYAGKLLRVDLNSGKISEYSLDMDTLRKYIGGTVLGMKILYDEVSSDVEWFDPENRLILLSGPLGGTKVGGSGTFSVVTKGALTNGATSSQANGLFGAYLRFNGFDGIILQGSANKLVYLYIHDGTAELRDASHLKGKEIWETEDEIKEEVDKPGRKASVFAIGPAGENLVLIRK
jgi:aldehyde:ferredoxin oxidoreductase